MSNWIQDFKKPINLIPLIVSIISLSFAFISYDSRSDGRELSYKSLHNKIMESEPLTEIMGIYTEDGERVEQDVYVSYISFWNSGKIAINRSDILKEIEVVLNDRGRFISANKVSVRGEGITKIEAVTATKKSISISMDQLDLDMGAKYQFIYTAENREKIRIFDKVIEQLQGDANGAVSTFHVVGHIKEGSIRDAEKSLKQTFSVSFILTVVLSCILAFSLIVRRIFERITNFSKFNGFVAIIISYMTWFVVLTLCICFVVGLYMMEFGLGPNGLGVSMNDVGMSVRQP